MSEDKKHYNTQFLGEKIKLPQTRSDASGLTPPKQAGSKSLLVAAILGPILGVFVGAYAINGLVPFSANTSQVVINNVEQVNWVSGAAAKALPSVVTLSVTSDSGAGTGSGVVLTADGYILTNSHVVTLEGAASDVYIEVKTSSDRIFQATIVGTDPTNDLAVIKAKGTGFTPIEFADSSKLNVGEYAVAIGAPLGYDATVTAGVISAMHRTIQVASSAVPKDGGSSLELWNDANNQPPVNLDVIQTDAAINPGNSGGALVNQSGQLIGINVAIATANSSASKAGSIGVGFAIPSNTAKRVSDQIIKTGKVSHGLLGAFINDATNSENEGSFSIGAEVQKLTSGGPAEKAGLKVGDIVIRVDDEKIDGASKLTATIRSKAAFTKVSITVLRNGEEITLSVTLGDAEEAN